MPTDPTAPMTPKAREAYAEAQQRIRQCQASGDISLQLSYLGLTAVPPEIGQLTALTGLDLSRNQLSTLPPEIALVLFKLALRGSGPSGRGGSGMLLSRPDRT